MTTPAAITIRTATRNDIPAINRLSEELFARMAMLEPYSYAPGKQDTAFVRSVIDGERTAILVAVADNQIVGHAMVEDRDTPTVSCLVPHRFVRLMDLIVTDIYRGQGIGSMLIQAVKQWARARQAEYITLDVLAANDKAIRFYERHGLHPIQHTMHISLQ